AVFMQTYQLTGMAADEPILGATPPMGWNSWNAFEKDIDEKKIREIADVMVTSGLRDAGYEYLVIDDAWMAPERDGKGRLVGDPKRFPSGMKAMGDYIHSKGLKFGLYQDRGELTCQGLPGSLKHEQIDMATFAKWGVDYIKLDSCHAERNGRMSSVDYAIFHKAIKATGRPMILSISDFGNAAWAWGGKQYAQLWRTSNDIYPWMDSIYYCAQTSGGDQRSHPAFNGLWQFAGPGHWNDPDMLHVGNLKHIPDDRREIANRTHFSLWCILAAPLMAGNDLRSMSDTVKSVLTAPEVIAVNQDPRGVQGYKVFSKDGREVYCKPLTDGTAALLFLNRKREKADISIAWKTIGLSGTQPVRDLWARRDLGTFDKSFTATDVGWHESLIVKVGRQGRPLPVADPVPLEKYTVTREGVTYLSDLYYIWKAHHAPVYDATFANLPIPIDKKKVAKGIGCKGKSAFIFMVNGKAKRFRARVQMDPSSPADSEGRFKVQNEDFFSNRVLWDSQTMSRDSAAMDIDIDISEVQCLMLVFEGQDAFGNWGEARVSGKN
ncbi:MAG: NPCBM/NEW2 domain-containing protein, partial [Planctomycetaceae bacterium]